MPTLDFMILCDYVHLDNQTQKLYVLGAGIDQVTAGTLPTSHNAGLALRLFLTRAECGRRHPVEVIFQEEDGNRPIEIRSDIEANVPEGHPRGVPIGVQMAINLGLPLPKVGTYSLVLLVGGSELKDARVTA